MNKLQINLEEKYAKKLGVGPTAKKLFQEINKEPSVVLNFENIEFMSRSFAQEYVFQKHNSNVEIEEINMDDSIRQLLNVVEEDFKKTCLNS
ncbi:STAS-like domain-containing protein [Methanobrevibacter sp.]|uniref:STAS-like domain-containing protein n=1 Tax=Methanobrevibacter sp. TaxID=66852 RepID=UPI003890DDCF